MRELIGRYLSTSSYNRLVEGTVVHVIRGGDQFTHQQMLDWAKIDRDHKCYRSVRGPAKVDRVVLARGGDAYWIAPLHLFVR